MPYVSDSLKMNQTVLYDIAILLQIVRINVEIFQKKINCNHKMIFLPSRVVIDIAVSKSSSMEEDISTCA